MKAILITFEADNLTSAQESLLITQILRIVSERTNANGTCKMNVFSDQEVNQILATGLFNSAKSKRNSDFEKELFAYCKTVLKKTGMNPRNEDDDDNKILFIKSFFLFPELREPKRVLHWLNNCTEPTAKCQNILGSHGLSNLPDWVREIMSITNIL